MSQKLLLDEDDALAILKCLRVSKDKDSFRLMALIEEKMESSPVMDRIREEGIANYTKEGEVEIDPGAAVSIDDSPGFVPDGAYVMGWVWVENPDKPDEDETPKTDETTPK